MCYLWQSGDVEMIVHLSRTIYISVKNEAQFLLVDAVFVDDLIMIVRW